jgi:hypothetical protein
MKTPLLTALVCLAFSPFAVSARECAAGQGSLAVDSFETDASKLRYLDERGVGSYDVQISIEATSRESVKQLDADLYALGDAVFVSRLRTGSRYLPSHFTSFTTRAVRIEGEHGRAKCIFFNAKKAVDPRAEPIAFLEGPDGGDFKLCINEEGRVHSTLHVGVSKDTEVRDLLDRIAMSVEVPNKGTNQRTVLFTTDSSGCHSLGVRR